jgi:muramoyltetrapeptide carboxypeptidase LdcA involved in peptidoglycan recycling
MNIPNKLKKGSHIRVIAPSRSMGLLSDEVKKAAISRFNKKGFRLSFGKHVDETDEFYSSSIKSRIEDLHEAFSDTDVDGILTVIGGYNSNQMLKYIDYDLLAKNPKIFCGFSDVTAIANAITTKSNFITYTGPHFSSWAIKYGFEYSIDNFIKCCMSDESFELFPSSEWSDDPWYMDQEKREFIKNEGYWTINSGKAKGRTVGSHVRCLSALQGTEYWPNLENTILLLEEDAETNPPLFDRLLQSLIQLPDFSGVKGIIIGRFQKDSKMTKEKLHKIIKEKPELDSIPIVANVNFGHTLPLATLPIGGEIEIEVSENKAKIVILKH